MYHERDDPFSKGSSGSPHSFCNLSVGETATPSVRRGVGRDKNPPWIGRGKEQEGDLERKKKQHHTVGFRFFTLWSRRVSLRVAQGGWTAVRRNDTSVNYRNLLKQNGKLKYPMHGERPCIPVGSRCGQNSYMSP